MPASTMAPTTSNNALQDEVSRQPSKEDLATRAIASNPSPAAPDSEASPSLQAIWQSFKEHGQGDTELLKLILNAKAKEDERLKAMDDLRLEQLRAQQIMWQYTMYQYMLVAAAQQQAQPPTPSVTGKGGLPPYSPLSPPSEHAALGSAPSLKRSRASSSASAESSASDAPKKARTGTRSPPRTLAPGQKPSHADVMEALRRKCEANKQAQPVAAAAIASARTSPAYPNRQLAPAPPQAPASTGSRASMSPPLASAPTRRLSPPQIIPGRHTSFLRPAPPPPAPSAASASQGSAPRHASPSGLAALHEAPESPARSPATSTTTADEPQQTTPRNKLALLLHASESTASHFHTPTWHSQPQAATSDVRGPIVPAPAVVSTDNANVSA